MTSYSLSVICRKYCRKEKMQVTCFFPLSKDVFKSLLLRVLKCWDCVEKSSELTLSSIYTNLKHTEEKSFWKTSWKKVKSLRMNDFTLFHNVFYGFCILKSFTSHISVVICSFFQFGMVSKWCIREWVKQEILSLTLNMDFLGQKP